MTFSCLSEAEIREKFAHASNKKEMLHVLADLTCSSTQEMKEFLGLSPTKPINRTRTLDKEQALRMFQDGASDQQIADAMNIHLYAVKKWRWDNKLYRTTLLYPPEDIRILYEKGMSDEEIAHAMHCGKTTILRWRKQNGNLPPHVKRRKRKKAPPKLPKSHKEDSYS